MSPELLMMLMGGSALANLGGSIFGATTQAGAAKQATQVQQDMFNRIANNMQPFISFGSQWGIPGYQQATQTFENAIPGLTTPLTAADVAATPGFQFMLEQGDKDIASKNAAMGLGSSGALLKGLKQYETGLASTTIPTWLNQLLGQRQQIYNMLQGGITPFGQAIQTATQAGGVLGGQAVQTGANVGGNILGAGNAAAAAGMNVANNLGQMPNQYMQYTLLNSLLNKQGTATAGSPLGTGAGVFGPNPLQPGGVAPGATSNAVPYTNMGTGFGPFAQASGISGG